MYHSAIAVVVAFVLGFPIAVFVRRRITEIAQHRVILLFILPFMVSEIIRIFSLRPLLQRNGLVNTVLQNIGLIVFGLAGLALIGGLGIAVILRR